MSHQSDIVPDVAGKIRAYRAWKRHDDLKDHWWLIPEDGLFEAYRVLRATERPPYTLCSTSFGTHGLAWRTTLVTAKCGGDRRHAAPCKDCTCGLYACRTLEDAIKYAPICNLDRITFGAIDIWGHVLEYDRGFRAEFAQIVELYGVAEPPVGLDHIMVNRVEPLEVQRWRHGVCLCAGCKRRRQTTW